jgi:hypothetical protein
MTLVGKARERRIPANLQLPHVVEAEGTMRNLEDCIALSRAGRCITCGGDNHPFRPTNCRRVTPPQATAMKALNRQCRNLLRPMRQADRQP